MKNLLKISNLLSLLRIFLMFPIIWIYSNYMNTAEISDLLLCVTLVLLAILTDFFDGYFARKLNQVSEMGKILDPLADKIAIASLMITLYLFGQIPFWIIAVVIGRDFIIGIGALTLMGRVKSVPSSEWSGKITATLISLLILVYILKITTFVKPILIVTMLSIAYSLLDYVIKFIKAK